MPQVKVGIQLASLRQPFKKALHTAARLGADAVEIDARGELRPGELTQTGIRQLRKLLEDLNLRISAVGFSTRRGYNVADQLDRRVEATKRAMEFAYQLGTSVVVNSIGRIPREKEGPAWTTLLQVLADLGQHGQRVGALLAAETGPDPPELLGDLIDALPPGALCVNFDPGNLIINDYSPREAVRLLGPHIHHTHAKDGVRDLAQGRGIETPLGRGAADFPELLGALEEFGYRGYFTIERQHARDPITEIGYAVEYLRNL